MKSIISIPSARELLPALEWLPNYQRSWLKGDLSAGITVGIMLVPQSMAYALLAGLPPVYGLYAGLVPTLVYALMGSSRHLAVGPVAISALLVMAGVSQIAMPESEEFVRLALIVGLSVGVLQAALSVLQLGFLVNFLSMPVVSGFVYASVVIITVSQLPVLVGLEAAHGHGGWWNQLFYVFDHVSEWKWVSFLIGATGILLIWALGKWRKSFPGALVVVVIATIASAAGKWDIPLVGEIPSGLPRISAPEFSWTEVQQLFPTIFSVTIIGIVESISVAKTLESRHQYYEVRPNQELLGLGVAKIVGAFFQAFPTSGSFSRSAVNDRMGGRTQLTGIITTAVLLLSLLFFMPLFYYLPKSIFASIIIVSILGLFKWKQAVQLYRIHREDFFMMLVTFLVTLVLGIEEGVLAGVLLSVVTVLYRSSQPPIVVLGQLKDSRVYRNIRRFKEARELDNILIVRFDAPLYFGNAAFFKKHLLKLAHKRSPDLQLLLLEASSITDMDSTGLKVLEELREALAKKGITLYMSGVLGRVRDLMYRSGFMFEVGPQNQFLQLQDAVDHFLEGEGIHPWVDEVAQSNDEKE